MNPRYLPCLISHYSEIHNLHSEKARLLFLHISHFLTLFTQFPYLLKLHLSFNAILKFYVLKAFLKQNTNSKRYMHPNVHSSIIYNSQDMEAT